MVTKIYLFLFLPLISVVQNFEMQNDSIDSIPNFILNEVSVFSDYSFKNRKEEKVYDQMESDLRKIYPLVQIVRSEYVRINKELLLYDEEGKKEFLKRYESYVKENYMHYLSGMNPRQGRLFLKMITRELDNNPYKLIKEYRNGYRAFFWQGAAHLFFTNLKVDYKREDNPMIEHIMQKLDAEYSSATINVR